MSDLTDEQAAFPRMYAGTHQNMHGMSLRQWYAGMALNGLLNSGIHHDDVPHMARRLADMMIKLDDEAREARHGK